MSKYELSYIELYNPDIHGNIDDLNDNDKYFVNSNYLMLQKIKPDKFLSITERVIKFIDKTKERYKLIYELKDKNEKNRDMTKIINNNQHGKLAIIEKKKYNIESLLHLFPLEYTFAIDKTFWLKIFQRRWKKIYQNKLSIIKKMGNLHNIHYREIHGRWSFNTNIYNI